MKLVCSCRWNNCAAMTLYCYHHWWFSCCCWFCHECNAPHLCCRLYTWERSCHGSLTLSIEAHFYLDWQWALPHVICWSGSFFINVVHWSTHILWQESWMFTAIGATTIGTGVTGPWRPARPFPQLFTLRNLLTYILVPQFVGPTPILNVAKFTNFSMNFQKISPVISQNPTGGGWVQIPCFDDLGQAMLFKHRQIKIKL